MLMLCVIRNIGMVPNQTYVFIILYRYEVDNLEPIKVSF